MAVSICISRPCGRKFSAQEVSILHTESEGERPAASLCCIPPFRPRTLSRVGRICKRRGIHLGHSSSCWAGRRIRGCAPRHIPKHKPQFHDAHALNPIKQILKDPLLGESIHNDDHPFHRTDWNVAVLAPHLIASVLSLKYTYYFTSPLKHSPTFSAVVAWACMRVMLATPRSMAHPARSLVAIRAAWNLTAPKSI